MLLLVDGDIILYRAGFAAQRTYWSVKYRNTEYDEEISVQCDDKRAAKAVLGSLPEGAEDAELVGKEVLEPEHVACYNVKSMLENCHYKTEPDHMMVVLSGGDNFRNDVAVTKGYKANRVDMVKPAHTEALEKYMLKNYDTCVTDYEEADDWLGYTQYDLWKEDEHGSVIATIDKDLDMIPGLHYNFVHDRLYHVTLPEGNRLFWQQLLSGDSTDNIPGVPKIGPKKAQQALTECNTFQEYYDAALALYIQGYGPDKARDVMIEQGRLIWIRREPNEMWSPELMEEKYEPSS